VPGAKSDGTRRFPITAHPGRRSRKYLTIPQSHVLASVSGVFNAILVRGDVVGDNALLWTRRRGRSDGQRGGERSRAIAAHFPQEQKAANVGHEALHSRLQDDDEIISRYYLRLLVVDRPGVLPMSRGCLPRARSAFPLSSNRGPGGRNHAACLDAPRCTRVATSRCRE